jgi:hypothetical protein
MPSGTPLEYEFDFDEDGTPDRHGPAPTAHFVYEGSGTYTIRVTIRDPRWPSTTTLKQKVSIK